jgi:organic hydroperoxide reductase OsmC/OhrA
MPEVYRTSAVSTGDGRNGHSRTTDGMIAVDLATPRERGGPGGATNPVQPRRRLRRDASTPP